VYGEVQRRAGPVVRGQAELIAGFYLETLRERLSSEKSDGLAAHLPKKLAGHLEGGGGGGEFSVWEFYERFAQKAGLASEMAVYYARHVGDMLSGAVPQEEIDTVREELPLTTGSYRSACSRILIGTDRSSASPILWKRPTHRCRKRASRVEIATEYQSSTADLRERRVRMSQRPWSTR
jgi:uncharacterized protein (DUF2267 family)